MSTKRKSRSFGKGKPGSGSRFAACVKEMKGRKGVYSPEGLCAAIGRRKYGAGGMAAMSAAGKRNPLPASPSAAASKLNNQIAKGTRGGYYPTLGHGIDAVERTLAPLRLDFGGIYLEPVTADKGSRLYSIPIVSGEGALLPLALAMSYYRMPSGNYEITAYVTPLTTRGRRNPYVPLPELIRRREAAERYLKDHPPTPKAPVHTRTPRESLQYEVDRYRGESVGRMNPAMRSFHEIGYYDEEGGYHRLKGLGVGRVNDSDAWLMAKEEASEMGHPVVLVGRGSPVMVAPRGGRLNPREENPAAGHGWSTAVPKGNDSKTGLSATTYANNLSCPTAANSSRACPFLGSGCYAEYGNTNWTRLRVNKAAKAASPTPDQIAEDEALEITKKIVEPVQKKGGAFLPLRLHVVGDCVTDKAARTLAEAVKPILDKGVPVWTYTHAWRDVSRSSWGGVSVLASCETVEDTKRAMGKGYATAMVVEKFPGPQRFEQDGVKIQPCPNEAVSKDIKCSGGEGAKACRLCFNDKRLLSEKTVIAFDAHSGGKKKVVAALNNIEGTKPGSKEGENG